MSIRSLLETVFGAGARFGATVDPAQPIDDDRTLRIARAPLKGQPAAIHFVGPAEPRASLVRQ